MRFLLLFVAIVSAGQVFAAPRVAILGASEKVQPVADMIMVDLADEFEFVERTALNKMLEERRLAAGGITGGAFLKALWPVDIFAVVDGIAISESGVVPFSMTVYDANNGIRLIYAPLNSDIETAADIGAALLREATAIKEADADPTVISIVSVDTRQYRMLFEQLTLMESLRLRLPDIEGVVQGYSILICNILILN